MKRSELNALGRELTDYLDEMTAGMGRPERRAALQHYLTGLLLDGERKSIEPMAARLAPSPDLRSAFRDRLKQCITYGTWSDAQLFKRLARKVDRLLPGIEAFVDDDTGFAKKGSDSVGVARQYSGTLGRIDNCQVATSLHLAGERGSAMVGFRLYLPKSWTDDRPRCDRAGVPEEVRFAPKWQLALGLIDQAREWGVRRHPVLGDAAYGDCRDFREALEERGLGYVLAVSGSHKAVPVGESEPVPISELARRLHYEWVTWRDGSGGKQRSRFAAMRVQMAEGRKGGRALGEEEWLVCEFPRTEGGPTKFYVSNLHSKTELETLVRLAKLRWRVERDYQELKGEIGLDHFEGRSWRGFHHHATLCALAHGFLTLRRALFPPEEDAVDAADGEAGAAATPAGAAGSLPDVPALH